MVRPGEYLERPAVILGEVVLDGLYHRGALRPGVVIAPPSPEAGGSMLVTVVAELAWAATRAGHPTLRFDHRGVGASAGGLDPSRRLDDLLLAASHLAGCLGAGSATGAVTALAGVGAGARLALDAARASAEVPLVFAVAPEPPLAAGDLEGVGARVVVALPGAGSAAVIEGTRRAAGGRARVEVVAGADPAFVRGLVPLGRLLADELGRIRAKP